MKNMALLVGFYYDCIDMFFVAYFLATLYNVLSQLEATNGKMSRLQQCI